MAVVALTAATSHRDENTAMGAAARYKNTHMADANTASVVI
jgi:hypothetical protein